jgi:Dyp-type peroxidase family
MVAMMSSSSAVDGAIPASRDSSSNLGTEHRHRIAPERQNPPPPREEDPVMQRETVIKGASLGDSSDLTLLAPLRQGFVESLESVTWRTRTQRVLASLHGGRRVAHEHSYARLLSDAVERVGVIQSVRVAVLDAQDAVLLAVSFDGPWEAYIRTLYEKVGTLLDLVFCGTQDYVTAHGHRFDEWLAWAQRVQVETPFFYGPPAFTAHDVQYHRRVHLMHAQAPAATGPQARLNNLRAMMPSAEEAMERLIKGPPRPAADEPAILRSGPFPTTVERVRTGLQSLAALYRLTDLHPPGTPDGAILHRAAVGLLREFLLIDETLMKLTLGDDEIERFRRQLAWIFPPGGLPPERVPRDLDDHFELSEAHRANIQGGIVRGRGNATHGAVVLMAFDGPEAAQAWLAWAQKAATPDSKGEVELAVNVALTAQGLHALGLPPDLQDEFPQEFRQGMAARCSTLGDLRQNHPRRWRLPARWNGIDQKPGAQVVDLQAVHAVVLLHVAAADKPSALAYWDADHPLRAALQSIDDLKSAGARILAVQAMRRVQRKVGNDKKPSEHFGWVDGISQPEVEWPTGSRARDHVPLGEVLLGWANSADDNPVAGPDVRWRDGSFLVMRKYRQFVGRLRQAVLETARQLGRDGESDQEPDEPTLRRATETVYGKLMGRERDGTVVTDPRARDGNNFDYDGDPDGAHCPLHAHVRRANPRTRPNTASKLPRIMRRGMSYGPDAPEGTGPEIDDDEHERGLVFMAYNARLGEQFEVIQRWLAGGNSTGGDSQTGCPIVGVPQGGMPRRFGFEEAGQPLEVVLDAPLPLLDDPLAPTRLEWGLYLFVPSMQSLADLQRHAAAAAAALARPVPWDLANGRAQLRRLLALEASGDACAARAAWKAAIEDPQAIDRLDAAALLAAVRADAGGLLRTSYGVLVADRELLGQVFLDPEERYSVCGHLDRMRRSFGEIALGLDDGPEYREQSSPINDAIGKLDPDKVFALARETARDTIEKFIDQARAKAAETGQPRWEVVFEAREVLDEVLAAASEEWFGIRDHAQDDKSPFDRGPQDLAWDESRRPRYPGHFTALSRYMFQPHPGPMPVDLGQRYGRALVKAMQEFVERCRGEPARRAGAPLTQALFDTPTLGDDDAFIARTIVGVMMGFTPTTIGAAQNVLAEWRRDGSFARLRQAVIQDHVAALPLLADAVHAASLARPMPQIAWRTVRKAHRLGPAGEGGLDLHPGDLVAMAMVSGTHQSLADGRDDGRLMFGGRRCPFAEPKAGPTHACPGYVQGLAAVHGALLALLEHPEAIREGVSAGTFQIEGGVEQAHAVRGAQLLKAREPQPPAEALRKVGMPAALQQRWDGAVLEAQQSGHPKRILAWGDSWLDYRLALGGFTLDDYIDLRDTLKDLKYSFAVEDFCDFNRWGTITGMAADRNFSFRRRVSEALEGLDPPVALVLSGGGNDSTRSALGRLLRDAAKGPPVLDADATRDHVANLGDAYEKVIDDLIANAIERAPSDVARPVILIHGYDHPIPAGNTRSGGIPEAYVRTWLFDPFRNRGYRNGADVDLSKARPAMQDLIDALNVRLKAVADARPKFVRYVDLRGTIAENHPGAELDGWDNDLHPTEAMFRAMALKLHAVIRAHVAGQA